MGRIGGCRRALWSGVVLIDLKDTEKGFFNYLFIKILALFLENNGMNILKY
tara:strand:- start:374 stop:526 length:153 start_codon:yes stop_codon:yes gene_type:complete